MGRRGVVWAPNSAETLTCSSDDRPKMSEDANLAASNGLDLNSPAGDKAMKKDKKRKKKSRKLEVIDADEFFVTNIADDEETTKAEETEDHAVPIETPEPPPDNLVLRKLLRGPRYFDPPDTNWGSCYNCGEQGHKTADCTATRRKKPCYYCGSTDHNFKKCTKGRDCFICKKGGHQAKDCPEKNTSLNNGIYNDKICLKCGDSGHGTFSCRNNYFPEDLKAIQCYVCNDFGHLCCYNSADHVSKEVSCFKCGNLGHTGLACARLLGETASSNSPSACYNCGEGGHFARECHHPLKAYKKSLGEMVDRASSACHSCGKEGHFLRDCPSSVKGRLRVRGDSHGGNGCHSCGVEGHFARECPDVVARNSGSEMSYRNKKIRFDEDGSATYSEPKRRAGWIMEHPADSQTPSIIATSSRKRGRWAREDQTESPPSYRQFKNSRESPATAASWNHQNRPCSYGGQSSESQSHKKHYLNQPELNGSTDRSYHQRFPASRFYNYSSNSSRSGIKSNDWW